MLKKIIGCEKKIFESLIEKVQATEDETKKLEILQAACSFAVNASTGLFASHELEREFLAIAYKHSLMLPSEYEENSFLHVMTEAYDRGGHTRVVERWIELAPPDQKHSLFFTGSSDFVPERLESAIANKGGSIFFAEEGETIRNALELRKIASSCQAVILHTHMNDILPTLAFGTPEFKRPVLLFNHGDHKFWVGISIADIVLELREFGYSLTEKRRASVKHCILGVPADNRIYEPLSKEESRERLGVPDSEKVLLTVGSAYKYHPFAEFNFVNYVDVLLAKNQNFNFFVVGVDENDGFWQEVHKKYAGRLRLIGGVPHEKLAQYFKAADLVIDSFPVGGGTALMDAIALGCPVLAVDNPAGQFDYLYRAGAVCKDFDTLVKRTEELLGSAELLCRAHEIVKAEMDKEHCAKAWSDRLRHILELSGHNPHQLQNFSTIHAELESLDFYLVPQNIKTFFVISQIWLKRLNTILYKFYIFSFLGFIFIFRKPKKQLRILYKD